MALTTPDQVDATTGESFDTIVGEEAHIHSAKPDGPRYDPNYPADNLETYENRILLCRNHHKFVDYESGRAYTAEELLEMKERHEQLREALRVVIDRVKWTRFRHLALILEMHVSVTNCTDTEKQLTEFQLDSAGQVPNDPDVSDKVNYCRQGHNTLDRWVEPGEPVTGWMGLRPSLEDNRRRARVHLQRD